MKSAPFGIVRVLLLVLVYRGGQGCVKHGCVTIGDAAARVFDLGRRGEGTAARTPKPGSRRRCDEVANRRLATAFGLRENCSKTKRRQPTPPSPGAAGEPSKQPTTGPHPATVADDVKSLCYFSGRKKGHTWRRATNRKEANIRRCAVDCARRPEKWQLKGI